MFLEKDFRLQEKSKLDNAEEKNIVFLNRRIFLGITRLYS